MQFLFQPVRPFVINQRFGRNNACISTDGTKRIITCDGDNPPEGFISAYGKNGHQGVDLNTYSGQPVYCAYGGEVYFIDTNPRSGLDVRIISEFAGEKYIHIYEHLLGHNTLKIGQKINTGDCIGWADNTGYSSGDHLHFELRRLENQNWVAVDPLPYFNSYFAPDVTLVKGIMEGLITALEELVDKMRKVERR